MGTKKLIYEHVIEQVSYHSVVYFVLTVRCRSDL